MKTMGKNSKKKARRGEHRKRMSREKRDYLERAGYTNKHHMLNRCKNGGKEPSNMLRMDERRHSAFHLVFKNLDFIGAAKLLIRTHNMKKGTNFRIVGEQ